ncbi:MAG: putative metal-binding motif-containing protein, partial [Euryarchaeota archaeon]|nr:putative metal-binding motif-containing protein [Euryarchaeota archaeon]
MKRMNLITTLTLLGVLVLAACASSASATSEWTMDLSAEMAGDTPITANLTYGVDSSATDGYDDGLDTNAPLADPSGFDAYFNEPGVGTGKLNANIKALGTVKDWTLMAVAPATKTVDVSWTSGDILSNVDMQMQEIDPSTGDPTGSIIDMKTQEQITVDGGAYIATTKIYKITATMDETAEPPELVSCVIDPTPPVKQGTNISIDCLFSETVDYEIRIENATGHLVEEVGSGTAKNPKKKWWNTTTETSAGTYIVNVTMDNSTSGMSAYNNTNTIEVTPEDVMTTYYGDADGDGYGDPENTTDAYSAPTGYVTDNTDCDDTNADVNPGATEVCNGIDDNCDGQIDEGVMTTYYGDADGDGYGDPENATEACSAPDGYVTDNTDCDDTNADVNPGATEVCGNGI